jgi:hypothetical protein
MDRPLKGRPFFRAADHPSSAQYTENARQSTEALAAKLPGDPYGRFHSLRLGGSKSEIALLHSYGAPSNDFDLNS